MENKKRKILYAGMFTTLLFLVIIGSTNASIGSGEVPIGTITMWTGNITSNFDNWGNMINDTQWHLCNGHNGTINLQGKFIVGYDPEATDYDTIGETGGLEAVALTIDQLPYHEHTYNDIFTSYNGGYITPGIMQYGSRLTSSGSTTSGVGENKAHENRPPYTVVAYIQRLY